MDLVLDLLRALAAQLHDQAADLGAGVEGEVFLAIDGGPRVGDGEDRDGIEVAPSGLEPSPASAASRGGGSASFATGGSVVMGWVSRGALALAGRR